MYQRALSVNTAVFGPSHPAVAATQMSIALIYKKTGKYEESERLNRQCYDMLVQFHGEKHSSSLSALINLADVLRKRGDFTQSRELYEKALSTSTGERRSKGCFWVDGVE